jgi:hypothetical protein
MKTTLFTSMFFTLAVFAAASPNPLAQEVTRQLQAFPTTVCSTTLNTQSTAPR